MWRCFGYQTYPAPNPSVVMIKVKLPSHLIYIGNEGKMCDMEIYFRRPYCLSHLKYTEFYELYDYSHIIPSRFQHLHDEICGDVNIISNSIYNMSNECIDILKSSKLKTLYIYKKMNPTNTIVRMGMVYIYMGEIYYLRLLLLNMAAMSYNELLTVNGVTFTYFQQSAVARGLISNEQLGLQCFKEATIFSTPSELRFLFVLLTLNGYPTICIYENEDLKFSLYADYYNDAQSNTFQNRNLSNNKLLKDLQQKFEDTDRTLDEYGLPLPLESTTELQRELLKYDPIAEQLNYNSLMETIPNTDEQNIFLDEVKIAIDNNETKLFFLNGEAGSGKTTTAKKIISYARSKSKIVLGCAATALAAQTYKDFDTFHGLFKYPVVEDSEEVEKLDCLTLNLENFPQRKELINAASVIIWDEAPSNEYHCFKTVFEYFKQFKGKVVILLGDWRQTAPVVVNGKMADICKASILNSDIWKLFSVHKLSINMRIYGLLNNNQYNEEYIEQQKQYAKMLLLIGEGSYDNISIIKIDDKELYDENNELILTKKKIFKIEDLNEFKKKEGFMAIKIPLLSYINNMENAIDFVYPLQFRCIDNLCDSAILCATNKSVNKWNEKIQSYNPEKEHVFLSEDSFECVDDPNEVLANMITTEVLNEYNVNNVPQHKLIFKVNDICFIMRNLFKKDGLTNNTRVRIVQIHKYIIRVCTLNTKNPKFFNIPRIRFNVNLPYGNGYTMCRRQFPLRLAYSMTYNKSQGQELNRCLVDITSPPFTHGHLYVALSRIRNCHNIMIYYDEETLLDKNDKIPIFFNFVYKSLRI